MQQKVKNQEGFFAMTIALCLLQSSLQSCYANHSLQVRAASLLPHTTRGEPPAFIRDVVTWPRKPRAQGHGKAWADLLLLLPPVPFDRMHCSSHSEEVTWGPQQSLANAKQNEEQGQDQLWKSDSFLHCAANITERYVFSVPVTRKTLLLPSFSSTCINRVSGWPRSFYVIHFSVNRTKINVNDGSHITLLAYSKLSGHWEHRSGQMSTLQHACAANS